MYKSFFKIFSIIIISSLMIALSLPNVEAKKNQTVQPAACHQPRTSGPCRGRMLRYAYDDSSGKCTSFYYSGCGATKNNFHTYEECRRDCMKQLRY
ncbi:trypsin inhibitor-like [Glossina fuscipes]|uniref:Trypsin inhibitor-like n=1 Tax=Glossina fuscipes TaxID=7396 RepID=A0A8U0WBP4_9MUSC|nr:trypsin inhibitor-like [Glossina fuscipes]